MTTIGEEVFHECDKLATVNFNGGTTIGKDAFSSCINLVSVTIPNSVTTIGENAFEGCNKLETINIGSGLTSIAPNAFGGCQKVSTITVDENNTAFKLINNVLFSYDGKTLLLYPRLLAATEYTILGGVTTIGSYAFEDCRNLTSVTIPDGVTTIGDNAFSGCDELTSINIPTSVTSIGEFAFFYCSKLATITIPASVTTIGRGAFDSTPWIDNQSYEDGVLYVNNIAIASKDISGAIRIKSGTTAISDGCFEDCDDLTSVIFPASVKSIGVESFKSCGNLVTVTFEDESQLESIGAHAFEYCNNSNFNCIVIPASVTSIGESAFCDCKNLYTTYMLPITPPTLGEYAFTGSIVVPAAVYADYYNINEWNNYGLMHGYTVTCDADITATSNAPIVAEDETVTLSANRAGYVVDSYSVTKDGTDPAETVTVTETSGVYTFTMPASNVTVSATWKKDFTLCTATVPDQTLGRFNPATNSIYKTNKIRFVFEDCPALIGEEVKDGETELTLGTDYEFGTITYASPDIRDYNTVDDDKVGDVCQVEIIGKGEYIGTKTATFTIVDPNGSWGDLAWSLENGMLTISGTGAMNAADNYGRYPWGNYCADVTSITIGDGVTSIANHAFGGVNSIETYSGVKKIIIPASVTSIGADAFKGCISTTDVYCYADPTKLTWADDNDFIVTDVAADKTKCHVADVSAWSGFKNVNVTFVGDLAEKSIPYIDADGNTQYCTNFTALTGNETPDDNGTIRFAAGWYVVNSNITYNAPIALSDWGDDAVTIILKDGCTMNVGTSEHPINGKMRDGITCWGGLNIYGQSLDAATAGTLCVYHNSESQIAICGYDYTQHSGNVVIHAGENSEKGINSTTFTLNGGTFTARNNNNNGNNYAIYASTVIIHGGTLIATAPEESYGIWSEGSIILGWRTANESITVSKYRIYDDGDSFFKVADGQAFTDGTNTYLGTLTNDEITAITGKTLQPITGVTLTDDGSGKLTATLNPSLENKVSIPVTVEVDHVDVERTYEANKASTVYLPFTIALDKVSGGKFHTFTGVNEGTEPWTVTYTEVPTDGNIEANTPYIFLPNGGKITVNNGSDKITVGTSIASTPQTATGGWEFIGTYEPIKWTTNTSDPEYNATRAAEIGSIFGFAAQDASDATVGQFVKVTSGASIKPMRAYLKKTTTSARAMSPSAQKQELPDVMKVVIVSANGSTTEIGTIDTRTGEISLDEWFSLDGHRLAGKPTKPGLYIKNGKKVAIK